MTITLKDLRTPRPEELTSGNSYARMAREQAALEELFKLMMNKEHWKGPIDAIIDLAKADLEAWDWACAHFTATHFHFVKQLGNFKAHVRAKGYWGGPCA